ncbi:hypothetical protein [Microcoleus anatoxicus]|uniref:hypothetical protein n=1 Tax=Microcoleus anatoxicus TaxID=2705319 RepID=UPI0030C8DD87
MSNSLRVSGGVNLWRSPMRNWKPNYIKLPTYFSISPSHSSINSLVVDNLSRFRLHGHDLTAENTENTEG